jgi:hypothetical protein
MANTTNYNWETPDDTDLVKDGAAAIRTLGNSIDTTTKALNPETTLGDIAYRSSTSNTNTRLPIGSNGQILGVSAGVPAWINNDQGDITEVQAGTGISVASGTGPIPVVTNTVATAYDAKADLVVGTGADTFARLAVGTNNFVLTAASGETTGLKWQGFSGVRLTKSAPQTIATSTNTVLTFDTETYDTDSYHSTVTNTSRITIPSGKTGYYNVIASCIWAFNSGSYRNLHIYKNGSNLTHILTGDPGTTYPNVNMLIVDALYLTAGDYIEMNVFQATGGNLDIQSNAQYQGGTRFEAYYLGA